MQPFQIRVSFHSVVLDSALDSLIISHASPNTRRRLKNDISRRLVAGQKTFNYTIHSTELVRLSHDYGEQYVENLCVDVDRFFALENRRYTGPDRIRPELIVMHLFGRTAYRPNISAFGAAGEAIAGYCLEQFGYRRLMRPLGVMPDILFQINRGDEAFLALTEAKASTVDSPRSMIQNNAFDFLLDITSRIKSTSFHYEGYLVASQFKDQHVVDCACLHIDLGYCRRPGAEAPKSIQLSPIPAYDKPGERLQSILHVIAETAPAKDRYLSALLTEEAKRTASIKLLEEGQDFSADLVTNHIRHLTSEMGVAQEWTEAEEQIGEGLRAEQDDLITTATVRYKHPGFEGPNV
jgi:hypothetical protein